MKRLIGLCVVLMMAGCATVEGLGKDIQKAGERLEEAAQR
ncbi:entericidin A/B family lipoprotein [Litorivicinus lipolyticus]|jgi:predicted small secreted protein|uniref:Entericidin A/B family lipoprotein n=1 Tax=Litorivicinus lipolyticus TaxID=418701 RepID=A0A5Q2QBH6_9GAMM|nr:entericidin A/B family lipoprotein [Litorivicinus lipolyticus]QGG79170.1 entericidin A/B family lipoprotein [Litorivicinus lipolyticus]